MSKNFKYILDFVGNNRQLVNAVNQSERKIADLGNKAKNTQGQLGGMMDGAVKKFLAIGSFAAITAGATQLISNVVNVRKEFEKYEAVLTITLGSSQKARQEMQMLQQFASQTPFALTELTGAFVKLTNYGLKPNEAELRKYGDLASSVGKGFDQLAEGVADAVTGEFERLKEFGIKARAEGDKITFTFKGQTTVVKNNAAAIKDYIVELGALKGVFGSMAAIAGTLGGKISNLGDSWDGFMNTLGKGTGGVMVAAIETMTSFVGLMDMAFKSIDQIKQAVSDKSITGSVSAALQEIADMKKSLMESGMTDTNAQNKALELYYDSINKRIAETNKLRKEGTYELKQQLLNERNGVQEYMKTQEAEAKAREEAAKKTTLQAGTVEGLSDKIKNLNDLKAKANSNDLQSIAIINAQIQALERQKKAIDAITADPADFRTQENGLSQAYLQLKTKDKAQVTGGGEIAKWSKELAGMGPMLDANQKKVDDWKTALIEKQQAITNAFQQGFQQIGQSVINGLGLAETGFEGFVGGLATTVIDLIAMFLAQSIAASIAGASVSGASTGPAAIFTTPAFIATAIAGVLGAFAAIPAFADGALAYGPTMGLIGEYPGASSNPEVIAPLSKLKGMIGGGNSQPIILKPSLEMSNDKFRVILKRMDQEVYKRT